MMSLSGLPVSNRESESSSGSRGCRASASAVIGSIDGESWEGGAARRSGGGCGGGVGPKWGGCGGAPGGLGARAQPVEPVVGGQRLVSGQVIAGQAGG